MIPYIQGYSLYIPDENRSGDTLHPSGSVLL